MFVEILCESKPSPYRTCFTRHPDQCDIIDRNTPPSRPTTMGSERIISGSIVLSLLQEDATNINCLTSIKLEELMLTYLADNIGNQETFEPLCVGLMDGIMGDEMEPLPRDQDADSRKGGQYGNAFKEARREVGEVIATALEFEVTFVIKSKVENWEKGRKGRGLLELEADHASEAPLDDPRVEERELKKKQNIPRPKSPKAPECTPIQTALCCSQHVINENASPSGQYCKELGCSLKACGSGRGPTDERGWFNNRMLLDEQEKIMYEQEDYTDEYEVYDEFGSSIDEIESAVDCFLENGGDIMSFQLDGYLNTKKILLELKKC